MRCNALYKKVAEREKNMSIHRIRERLENRIPQKKKYGESIARSNFLIDLN